MGSVLSRAVSVKRCDHNLTALMSKYTTLANMLPSKGFDARALEAASRLFAGGDTSSPTPRRYADSPWSLPANAIRVLALPLSDDALTDAETRSVASFAMQAARDVARALPPGARFWLPPSEAGLHATLFHPGLSPQFDTTGRLCHLPLPIPPQGCWQRAGLGAGSPSDSELGHELRAASVLASSVPTSLSFDVDRFVMTASGVLLLLLRPRAAGARLNSQHSSAASMHANRHHHHHHHHRHGPATPQPPLHHLSGATACVEGLRAAAAVAFPRAARRQTSGLVHVSLLRVLSLPSAQLGHGANASLVVRNVLAALDEWNRALRALRLRVTAHGMLYVRETQIMTLEGERHRLLFAEAAATARAVARAGATAPSVSAAGVSARASLSDVLAHGGTRTNYDLDREDSQKV